MDKFDVIIIGGGFTGLSAALELARAGLKPLVLEADSEVGGLAGSFKVGDTNLEKFYHHWFTNDVHVIELVKELGADGDIVHRPTRTGMYFANSFFRLSTPKDLLNFTPLGFIDRIRLGLLALRARKVRDWKQLESLTAAEWLTRMGGAQVYKIVWEPLLRGKFGKFADEISAVWFWNKLKLRGGSRGQAGEEILAYYKGGFANLAELLRAKVEEAGGVVHTRSPVDAIIVENGRAAGVRVADMVYKAAAYLATVPIPVFSDLLPDDKLESYKQELAKISYIGNVCLVLQLDRSLSETYWLNVNDPSFPYVAVIEHTNFEPASQYGGRHIVYLSKYLPVEEALYRMSDDEVMAYSLPHLKKMFPKFDAKWILSFQVWRANYSQPIIVRDYSKIIPAFETPVGGLYLCSMAQVYPEDRGTNYAIRDGRKAGRDLVRVSRPGVETPETLPCS